MDTAVAVPDVLDSSGAGRLMLRGGALRSLGYVLGVLLALISAPLLIRHLGVADFGRWVTITSLVFIVSGLTELGMTAVGLREYSVRDEAGRRALIRELLTVRLVAAIGGAVAAVLFAAIAGYGETLVLGTAIMSFGLILNAAQTTIATPLNAALRLGWVTAIDIARQVATVVLIAGLVLAGANLLPFFAVPVIGSAVAVVLTYALISSEIPVIPTRELKSAWVLVRETLPYAAATAFGVVYFRVEIILMSLIATAEETGIFGVAFRVVEIAAGIPWLLVNSAFPILARAARDDQARLRYALGRLFEGSIIAGVAMALALGFGAAFAVDALGGDESSVSPLQVLSAALVANFLVATWAFALLTLRRYRTLLLSNIAAFLLGGTLTLLLVPSRGALGAAIAVTATECALAFTYFVALLRARPDLRPPVNVLPAVAVAVAVTIASLTLLDLPSVVEAALAPASFVAVLAAFRAIPAELIDAARSR